MTILEELKRLRRFMDLMKEDYEGRKGAGVRVNSFRMGGLDAIERCSDLVDCIIERHDFQENENLETKD